MNFAFSEEQEEFRATLRRFLEEHAPLGAVARIQESDPGFDRSLWRRLAQELGLPGLHLPESFGGQGFGLLELGIAIEELGRLLVPSPFFSTVCLAAEALRIAGTPSQQARWLPPLIAGERLATLALLDTANSFDPAAIGTTYEPRRGEGFRLHGAKRLVTDADSADWILVAARAPGSTGINGIGLFGIEAGSPGLRIQPGEPLDLGRRIADIALDGVVAEAIGNPGECGAALCRTLEHARIALALESTAAAQACLDQSVRYAKERVQFARPIGSFQSIQHTCAELLLELESARSIAHWACWVAAHGGGDVELAASLAKSIADDTFLRAAEDNIHIHGGIGVTWEATPHLYYKRARSNSVLLDPPHWHRGRIAALQGF